MYSIQEAIVVNKFFNYFNFVWNYLFVIRKKILNNLLIWNWFQRQNFTFETKGLKIKDILKDNKTK